MDTPTKELLLKVIATQVVLYKKLDDIENKLKGSQKVAGIGSYADELDKKSMEALKYIKSKI